MVKIMHWQTCKQEMLHLFRYGGSINFGAKVVFISPHMLPKHVLSSLHEK